MLELIGIITLIAFLYYTIHFISQIIYKIIDKNKKIMWLTSDVTSVIKTERGLKFYKFHKGDKIAIENYDGQYAIGKKRKRIFSKKTYAPIDYLSEVNPNKKEIIIRILFNIIVFGILIFMVIKNN